MSYKSRMEYPRLLPSNEEIRRRATTYIERGLTNAEASDLVTIELVEEREVPIAPAEIKRKEGYLKKLKIPESK